MLDLQNLFTVYNWNSVLYGPISPSPLALATTILLLFLRAWLFYVPHKSEIMQYLYLYLAYFTWL